MSTLSVFSLFCQSSLHCTRIAYKLDQISLLIRFYLWKYPDLANNYTHLCCQYLSKRGMILTHTYFFNFCPKTGHFSIISFNPILHWCNTDQKSLSYRHVWYLKWKLRPCRIHIQVKHIWFPAKIAFSDFLTFCIVGIDFERNYHPKVFRKNPKRASPKLL